MTTAQLTNPSDMQSNLASSFGIASAVVIAGVLATWVFVKQDAVVTPETLIEQESLVSAAPMAGKPTTGTLLEQADIAFAAGRIIEPEFDNALNYYLTLLARSEERRVGKEGKSSWVA